MKYFFIASIGCFGRHLDCERIKNYFTANNVALTTDPQKADYLFISTCGLTKLHEDLSIDDITRFKRYHAKMIVGGCLPEMNTRRISDVFNGKTISTKDLDRIDELFPDFKVKYKDIPDGNRICLTGQDHPHQGGNSLKEIDLFDLYRFCNALKEIGRRLLSKDPVALQKATPTHMPQMPLIDINNNFFSLRIASGCFGACSYCNIKKAIGNLRSKPVSLLLEELRKALHNKQYRINIVSSDSGAYGVDIHSSLPELLESILKEDTRIVIEYLANMNPSWVCRYGNELLSLFGSKRIKSMSSAIQSGSERILKLMHRNTDLDDFKTVLKKLKKVHPRIRMRTQVIVGFPTETAQDIRDTIEVIKECRFNEVDVFYYHETEMMDSAKLSPKVAHEDIVERIRSIRKELSVFTTVNFFNVRG